MDSDRSLPPPPPGPLPPCAISLQKYKRCLRAERCRKGSPAAAHQPSTETDNHAANERRPTEGRRCLETTADVRNRTSPSRREEPSRSSVRKESGRLRPAGLDADAAGEADCEAVQPCREEHTKSHLNETRRSRSSSDNRPPLKPSVDAAAQSTIDCTDSRGRPRDICKHSPEAKYKARHPDISPSRMSVPPIESSSSQPQTGSASRQYERASKPPRSPALEDNAGEELLRASGPHEQADPAAAASYPQRTQPQRDAGYRLSHRNELVASPRRSARQRLARSPPAGPAETEALFLGEPLRSMSAESPEAAVESAPDSQQDYRKDGVTRRRAGVNDHTRGRSASRRTKASTAQKRPQGPAHKEPASDARRSEPADPEGPDRKRRKRSPTEGRPSAPQIEESPGPALMPPDKLDNQSSALLRESGRRCLSADPSELAHEAAAPSRQCKGTSSGSHLHGTADTNHGDLRTSPASRRRARSPVAEELQKLRPLADAADAVDEAEERQDRTGSRRKLPSIVLQHSSRSNQDEQASSYSNQPSRHAPESKEERREEAAEAIPTKREERPRRNAGEGRRTEDSRDLNYVEESHRSDLSSGRNRRRGVEELRRPPLSVGPPPGQTLPPRYPLHQLPAQGALPTVQRQRYPLHQLPSPAGREPPPSAQRHRYPLHRLPYPGTPGTPPSAQHQYRVGSAHGGQRLERRYDAHEAQLLERHESSEYRPSRRSSAPERHHARHQPSSSAAGGDPRAEKRDGSDPVQSPKKTSRSKSPRRRAAERSRPLYRPPDPAAASSTLKKSRSGSPILTKKRSRSKTPTQAANVRKEEDRNPISRDEQGSANPMGGYHEAPRSLKKRSRSRSPVRRATESSSTAAAKRSHASSRPLNPAAASGTLKKSRSRSPNPRAKKRRRSRSPTQARMRNEEHRNFTSREKQGSANPAGGDQGAPQSPRKRSRSSPRHRAAERSSTAAAKRSHIPTARKRSRSRSYSQPTRRAAERSRSRSPFSTAKKRSRSRSSTQEVAGSASIVAKPVANSRTRKMTRSRSQIDPGATPSSCQKKGRARSPARVSALLRLTFPPDSEAQH